MEPDLSQRAANWDEEVELLARALPTDLARALHERTDPTELLEIVLDLGREPEARVPGREFLLADRTVTSADLEHVANNVGQFGDDNRAGIERTLHRVSAIRNRSGRITGLTMRVGRAVTGTGEIIRDIVVSGQSILLLGRPGIGKTTMLRECARLLADELRKRVVIVDTSNEIAGDGDIPHPGIGRSRRMQVRTPALQHAVMIEAVENHMPQCIVIDEIGTGLEAVAARTIAERGVQLVGTAHGSNIDSLLVNPTLNDLLGGIQTVTLSDDEARRRGTQKSVLERKSPPTFDVLIEIQERERVVVHAPLAETVDEALRGRVRPPQLRTRDEQGAIVSRVDSSAAATRPSPFEPAPFPGGGRGGRRTRERRRRFDVDEYIAGQQRREREWEPPAPTVRPGPPLSIFPYGVSRSYLEQSLREMRLPVRIQHHVDDADLVLTLKNYYRRHDSPVRAAESSGIPIHVLRSNTVAQIKGALARVYGVGAPADTPEDTEPAMQDVLEGIEQMQRTGNDVELTPQNAYVRRLQHQLVESHALTARSTGDEPNRRLVILRPAE